MYKIDFGPFVCACFYLCTAFGCHYHEYAIQTPSMQFYIVTEPWSPREVFLILTRVHEQRVVGIICALFSLSTEKQKKLLQSRKLPKMMIKTANIATKDVSLSIFEKFRPSSVKSIDFSLTSFTPWSSKEQSFWLAIFMQKSHSLSLQGNTVALGTWQESNQCFLSSKC